MSAVAIALLGAGEFDPWSEPVDRWLLERSRNPGGIALVVPAAAAHEGEASFSAWGAKGLEHYARLGVPAEVLPLRTREDAFRPDVVARLEEASLVFVSGGNPARLAAAVHGTPFWDGLVRGIHEGLPYGGCSAGAAVLTERTFDSDAHDLADVWKPGVGLFRDTVFGPHWDIVDTWRPGARDFIVSSVRRDEVFVGLDEDTALVGDGRSWTVLGRQAIHVRRDEAWSSYRVGDAFEVDLSLDGAG